MDSVVIFRNSMLPRSETFVLAQARALQSYRPVLVGVYPSGGPSLVTGEEVTFLTRHEGKFGELRSRCYWKTGCAARFHKQVRALRPRLIHAHFALDGAAALPLQRALSVPLIATLHGYDVTRRDQAIAAKPEGRLYLAAREQLWRRATAFVCVSEFIREQALRRGFPEEKLHVLPIGIDTELFTPCDQMREAGLIVFVGRLVEKKGCLDLLRAVQQLVEWGCGVRAVFLGEGPLRPSLEHEARQLRLPCEFLGMQSPDVVRSYMGRARVFCVPSRKASDGDSEGLGMVFAEAQAMETPVVSYRHGGVPEVVEHGKTGILAEEGDTGGLAQALRLYLENEALWRQHGVAGSQRVRRAFSLAQQTSKLEQFYGEVTGVRTVELAKEARA